MRAAIKLPGRYMQRMILWTTTTFRFPNGLSMASLCTYRTTPGGHCIQVTGVKYSLHWVPQRRRCQVTSSLVRPGLRKNVIECILCIQLGPVEPSTLSILHYSKVQ